MPDQPRRYMLRRTLFPWKFDEGLHEGAEFAREYGIDEIIWKIEPEELSHGLPTLDMIREYLPWLNKSREQLAKIGVAMSINPWVTIGMRDAGWDLRNTFPDFDWLTDITGIQAKSQACFLGSAWRNWLSDAFEMYASTSPRVLWIEDDIRIIRHRPVYYSCYCEKHLAEFARRTGKKVTREQLAHEILKPGEPSPVRAEWLNFLGATLAEAIEQVAKRVYSKSPKVRLGLMCSAPFMHAAETRDWDRVIKAVTGPHESVTIRPAMGNYSEASPRGMYETREMVASTLPCIRRPVQPCGEVENWPFTRYSKSVRFSKAQVLLGMAMGCTSLTFNAYDHVGTPLNAEPGYAKMLRELRPRVDALAAVYKPGGVERGIQMLHHEQGPHFKHTRANAHFANLYMGVEGWAGAIQALGMSVTWRDSDVVAVSGQKLRAYRDRLDEVFSKGVLLDVSALRTLQEMGRGDLAGVNLAGTFVRMERPTSMELLTDPEFGQEQPDNLMTVDHLGLETQVGILEPMSGARVISKLVNADREPQLNGFVLFENALGGRVAVCPYVLRDETPTWFLNWHRQRQMQAVANWLFRGKLPLTVSGGAWPLAIRTDYSDYTLVSVMNVSLDAWETVEVKLDGARAFTSVERLGSNAAWSPISTESSGSVISLRDPNSLDPLDMVTYRFRQ